MFFLDKISKIRRNMPHEERLETARYICNLCKKIAEYHSYKDSLYFGNTEEWKSLSDAITTASTLDSNAVQDIKDIKDIKDRLDLYFSGIRVKIQIDKTDIDSSYLESFDLALSLTKGFWKDSEEVPADEVPAETYEFDKEQSSKKLKIVRVNQKKEVPAGTYEFDKEQSSKKLQNLPRKIAFCVNTRDKQQALEDGYTCYPYMSKKKSENETSPEQFFIIKHFDSSKKKWGFRLFTIVLIGSIIYILGK